jgi:hypothetical protein
MYGREINAKFRPENMKGKDHFGRTRCRWTNNIAVCRPVAK